MVTLQTTKEKCLHQEKHLHFSQSSLNNFTNDKESSPQFERRLPLPSDAKLDHIFAYKSPTKKYRSSSNVSRSFKTVDPGFQVNRFGFRSSCRKQTNSKPTNQQLHSFQTRNNPISNKRFQSGNTGLNINLDESTTPAAKNACLSSAQIKRNLTIPSYKRLNSRGNSSWSSYSSCKNNILASTSQDHLTKTKRHDRNVKQKAQYSNQDKMLLDTDRKQTKSIRAPRYKNDLNDKGIAFAKMSENDCGDAENNLEAKAECDKNLQINENENSARVSMQKSALENLSKCLVDKEKVSSDHPTEKAEVTSHQKEDEAIDSDSSSSSRNLSTCSLASGQYEISVDERNTKSLKQDQQIGSKTTTLSSCGEDGCPSLWSSNRSYFLRVTESRRKQHRKEWEQKKNKMGYAAVPSSQHRDRTILELQNELEKASQKIKFQEKEIIYLRKRLYMARAEKFFDLEKKKNRETKSDFNDTDIYKDLTCELPGCGDEKGHGDETVDGSLVVQVCGSSPTHVAKSCEPDESVPHEAGDVTNDYTPKEYDQGYFSLPRRDGSFIVSSPKFPACQLPTPTSISSETETTLFYRDSSAPHFSENSSLSLSTPTDLTILKGESVGCQTDLMLFSGARDDHNNNLILLQSPRYPHLDLEGVISTNKMNPYAFLNVVPGVIVVALLWSNSQHGNIVDLDLLLQKFVFPSFRKWITRR